MEWEAMYVLNAQMEAFLVVIYFLVEICEACAWGSVHEMKKN